MKEPRSFYVTVVSVNDAQEFPDNNAARFKARLPSPLPDRPEDWEVGLAGLFMPGIVTPSNAAVSSAALGNLLKGLSGDAELFHLFATVETGKFDMENDVTRYKMEDALRFPQAKTGVEWIHRVIDGLTQEALRKIPHGKRWWEGDKKNTLTFRWEGNDLLIDNKDTMLDWNKYPYFSINLTVALRMGWDGSRFRNRWSMAAVTT